MAESEAIIHVQIKVYWENSQELVAESKFKKRDLKKHALHLLLLSLLRQCAFKCRKPCFRNILFKSVLISIYVYTIICMVISIQYN